MFSSETSLLVLQLAVNSWFRVPLYSSHYPHIPFALVVCFCMALIVRRYHLIDRYRIIEACHRSRCRDTHKTVTVSVLTVMLSKRSPSRRRRLVLFVISCTLACPPTLSEWTNGQRGGGNASANAYGPGMRLSCRARKFPPKKAQGRKYLSAHCDAAAGGGGKVHGAWTN